MLTNCVQNSVQKLFLLKGEVRKENCPKANVRVNVEKKKKEKENGKKINRNLL